LKYILTNLNGLCGIQNLTLEIVFDRYKRCSCNTLAVRHTYIRKFLWRPDGWRWLWHNWGERM